MSLPSDLYKKMSLQRLEYISSCYVSLSMFTVLCSVIDKNKMQKGKNKARRSREDKTLMSRGTEQKKREKDAQNNNISKYK